jgi:outer membrane protein
MKKVFLFLIIYLFFIPNVSSAQISIVDITFLLKNSNKGKSIQKELDNLNSKNLKLYNEKKKKLEVKEKKVASKKNILSKEDFNNEVLKFRKEVANYENERKKSAQEINNIKVSKIAKLLGEINKILVDYSSKNSISTIIDKKNVIITKQENDITKEILKILNN